MALFKTAIRLTGKHAEIINKYSKDKGTGQDVSFPISDNEGHQICAYVFETRAHAYLSAGMLGILKGRTAEPDHRIAEGRKESASSTIYLDMIEKQRNDFMRLYHYMVLTEAGDDDVDSAIKRAFSLNRTDEELDGEQKRLENYVRGGLEFIDEIFSNCRSYEDVCNTIIELMDAR